MSKTSDLERRLAALSPRQRALLERRLSERKQARAASTIPRSTPGDGESPLSFAQERLWFLERWDPGQWLYNVPLGGVVEGPLDPGALAASLDLLSRRHRVLRSRFTEHPDRSSEAAGEGVAQAFDGDSTLELPVVDLGGLDEATRGREAARWRARESRRPFDLRTEIPIRGLLLREGADRHLLLVVAHHIAFDGWSQGVFLNELAKVYGALAAGAPPELSGLPIQYTDFARWQREHLRDERLEAELERWRRHLDGVPGTLELPTDRPRPATKTYRGATRRRPVRPTVADGLAGLCEARKASLFMGTLASFAALLGRICGRDRLAIGTPAANRDREEVQGLVGFFVNMLPLGLRLDDDPSFERLLDTVREVVLEAFSHQELPFEKLVAEPERLGLDREMSHTPIFQMTSSMAEPLPAALALGQATLHPMAFDTGTSKYDLTLAIEPGEERFHWIATYDRDLFDHASIERLLGQLEMLIEGACAAPEARLSTLPLLASAERQQLLEEWGRAPREGRAPTTAIHLVEEQVRRQGDAVALIDGDRHLTYAALAARADRLAAALRHRGIGPEDVVVVCLERSLELVTAILAVARTGGGYLPLDPSTPVQRLRALTERSGARVALCGAAWADDLAGACPEVLTPAAADAPSVAPRADADTDTGTELAEPHPEGLAYVIYTSGSTGEPKGVQLTHRGLARLVDWHLRSYRIGPDDRSTLVAGPAFDASVWELWPSLAAGSALRIVVPEVAGSPELLMRELVAHRVTSSFLPTPMAEAVLAERWDERPFLDRLLTGGDRLHAVPPDAPCTVVNHYGPTEGTVVATAAETPAGTGGATSPPIGRPIDGGRAYVLDARLALTPQGAAGELCLTGEGLARGYRGRPALTAAAFVPDPFGPPGNRLYRTGDRVRWLADGSIDFLGRIDHQVQVRGFRIELGEIESVLGGHPTVREAVVMAREGSGGAELVAYVVPAATVEPEALRSFLAERLPGYMVPARFMVLDTLPLTANGKVDRAALTEPATAPEGDRDGVSAVWSEPEALLSTVWEELLERSPIGRDDDFFALGGHSLLAARVVTRINAIFGTELPIRTLFEAPTIETLARRLEGGDSAAGGGDGERSPIERGDRDGDEGPAPLAWSQERLWFLQRLDPESSAYNVPLCLRLDGPLDVEALAVAVDGIVERHESLRTVFPAPSGEPLQEVLPPTAGVLSVLDLTELPEPERQRQAESHARRHAMCRFDLQHGPLSFWALVRLAEGSHLLLVNLHHLVADGWSMGLLLAEVGERYHRGVSGESRPTFDEPVRYRDYARWQRRRLADGRLDRDLDYWARRLEGAPPVLELPTDRPRPSVVSGRGASLTVALPRALHDGVEALGRRCTATPFMTLLAGWSTLLGRVTGQDAVVVGTPVANRTRPEIEPVVGLFVNTLALCTGLGDDPSFEDLLERLRAQTLDDLGHQELPFEKLVEHLSPERDLAYSPLFQVLFVLQDAASVRLELPGVEVSLVRLASERTKFDLSLAVTRGDGELTATFEYDRDLFDRTTIDRLARSFAVLLERAAAEPTSRLSALDLLAAGERHQVVAEWGQVEGPAAPWTRLEQAFEERARLAPDAVAIEHREGMLTYGALDGLAEALARRLAAAGVRPGARVGLNLPRDRRLVVAMLGILKAGGAYVPLDPAYPEERLAFMAEDAGLTAMVTDSTLLPELGDLVRGVPAVVRLDSLELEMVAEPGHPVSGPAVEPSRRGGPERLAYVIYTSGSTGRPKGVALEHRAAVDLLLWASLEFSGSELDRVFAATSVSFDLSIFEIFVTLGLGGTVALADNALELPSLPFSERITLVNTVPTVLTELLVATRLPRSVETVTLAGELLKGSLVRQIRESGEVRRLINLYGPSEDTTYSTGAVVPEGERGDPSIGWPLPNTTTRIVDQRLRLVPIGVPGELLLGGESLARGYLGRPALTAERFLPDPWADRPGARLYRTGDLVRHLADGRFEFVGRIDHQVKLRGHRIELGEIEAVLESRLEVEEAVVTVERERGGDQRLVAFVVAAASGADPGELRGVLRARLPGYMVPSVIRVLEALPRMPNGKIDRRALPSVLDRGRDDGAPLTPAGSRSERILVEIWREVLGVGEVGTRDNFFDLGGHSLLLPRVQNAIRERLGGEIDLLELFRYPTIESLAAHLDGDGETKGKTSVRGASSRRFAAAVAAEPVAIVGMAFRFPGAEDPEAFWTLLAEGREAITFFDEDELVRAGVASELLDDPEYVRARSMLAGVELFDAGLFGFSPREAEVMDPQQRLFLECGWAALEDAGCDPARYQGRIGVFGGMGANSYLLNNLAPNRELVESIGLFQIMIGNNKDALPTHLSYKLGLTGPSVNVNTACSTSLVAVHTACRSLLAGECEAALAGGVTVQVPQVTGYHYRKGGILSPDGHCRAFDAQAGGTVGGSGVGIVVLKPLGAALADGDTIHALVLGSAVNNDGAHKVGYTAPSIEGQSAVLAQALEAAGVEPGSVGYVEAHGTGTELGDPIEIAALDRAYGSGAERSAPVFVGSVKSNLGHLDTAAGVAGLVKAVLALEHGAIPPSVHYREPNPQIDLSSGKIRIADALCPWESGGTPRRAGISSFGIGGTNAHVILEEAPADAHPGAVRGAEAPPPSAWQLLVLSARTPEALDRITETLGRALDRQDDRSLADVAHTLQVGRQQLARRRAVVCHADEDPASVLAEPGRRLEGIAPSSARPVYFLFSGQGAQYPGMGADLYRDEPVFRAQVDRCAELLTPLLGHDLRTVLYPEDGASEEAARRLGQTAWTQPALFVTELALARLWESWGVTPAAAIGHSVGEYVAACLAGTLSVDDALALVAERGRLMQSLPSGSMVAVGLPADELAELIGDDGLDLAAVNAPGLAVASGPSELVDALVERVGRIERPEGEAIRCRRLHTSHAFHSAMMEPILRQYEERVAAVELRPPVLPFVSNVTGTWITAEQATDPRYWVDHLRGTVRFSDGLARLLEEPDAALVEVGPGKGLVGLVRKHLEPGAGRVVVPSLGSPGRERHDRSFLLETLARLWLAGVEVDWTGVSGSRRKVPLPTYSFDHQRYWVEPPARATGAAAGAAVAGEAVRAEAPGDGAQSVPVAAPAAVEGTSFHERPALATPFVEPEAARPRAVAAIWEELLGVRPVGLHDDFFDLGGHSLLAGRIVARVRELFGADLSVERLFEEPTVAGLAARLEEALGRPEGALGGIPRADRDVPPPIGIEQRRLWFLDCMSPGDPVYGLTSATELTPDPDPVDLSALARSLAGIVDRHEVLRIGFEERGGEPSCVVRPAAPLPLPVVDLDGLPAADRRREERQVALQAMRRRWDLTAPPLLRAVLVRSCSGTGDGRHVLLVGLHHIAGDAESQAVVIRELAERYGTPVPPETGPEALQYRDFVARQSRHLEEESTRRAVDEWRERLEGVPVLRLATDRPRPAQPSRRGGHVPLVVDREVSEALRALAREEGVTDFMALLAAFELLLYRFSGQRDLAVGSPVANRDREELRGLVGFFANTVVLRADLSGEPTFRELLGRVREATRWAWARQSIPFSTVVEALEVERSTDVNPLFQTMFNFVDSRGDGLEMAGLGARPLSYETGMTDFDLFLTMFEEEGRFRGLLGYATDLFEGDTAARMMDRLGEILRAVSAEPDRPVTELPVLARKTLAIAATFTADPVADVLEYWGRYLDMPYDVELAAYNQVFQELLDPSSLLSKNGDGVNAVLLRFEDWARFAGEGEEVRDEDLERNLDDLVEALHVALARGSASYVVGVCPPSPEAVESPGRAALFERFEERLAAVCADAGRAHLIRPSELALLYPVETAHDPHGDRLGHVPYTAEMFAALGTALARKVHGVVGAPFKVIALDCDNTLWDGVCGEDGAQGIGLGSHRRDLQQFMLRQVEAGRLLALCSKNVEEDVAAVLDGREDMVIERDHLVSWKVNWQPKSRNLQELADELSLGIDSFVFVDDNPVERAEVRANCPEVLTVDLPLEPDEIPRVLDHVWAFDVLSATAEDRRRTAMYRENAAREQARRAMSFGDFLESLKLDVRISAPETDAELARAAQLTQRTNQFNATTIRRTESDLRSLEGLECQVARVKDRFGDYGLVGVALFGEVGDALEVDTLLLSCRVLGRGVEHRILAHLGRLALERGLARLDVRFATSPKNRPVADFLRAVGGSYEIEQAGGSVFAFPAEVATELSFAPRVEETEEVGGGAAGGEKRMAAGQSSAGWRAVRLARIATELRFPEEVLRAVESHRPRQRLARSRPSVAPRTESERLVAGLWGELIGSSSVGIEDDFFESGGHSLLATQLLSRIQHACGVAIPLHEFFQRPTVAGVVEAIEAGLGAGPDHQAPPLEPVETAAVPLTFAQERLWALSQVDQGSPRHNISGAIEITGPLDAGALARSFTAIAARQESLRTTFEVRDGQPVQVVSPPAPVPLPVIDLGGLEATVVEDEASRLADLEASRPCDLANGPLLRTSLVRFDGQRSLLLLVIHHLVADGWSIGVLFCDFWGLYEEHTGVSEAVLSDLPVQYRDFASWQRGWLRGETLEAHLDHWVRYLEGAPALLELPTDRPRSAARTLRGSEISFDLGRELTEGLDELSRKEGSTLFMTLLAALNVLLFRYSHQEDVVVGTPIANRQRKEIEDLIGLFADILVVRTDLSGEPSFRDLLRRVRGSALQAFAHQHVPFGKIVEAVRPDREAGHNPLFQVMFSYLDIPSRVLKLSELELKPRIAERGTTDFDLFLTISAGGESLRGTMAYSLDLFDRWRVERMLEHLRGLLGGVVADPDRPISRIPMLGAEEREEILAAALTRARLHRRMRVSPGLLGRIGELVRASGGVTP